MADVIPSRVAKRFTGRTPVEPGTRHGSIETARTCTIRDGAQCELCRRALPDNMKRHKVRTKAVRTRACMSGAAGHTQCGGWRFASGNATTGLNVRGASACECPCHADGRGKPIPTIEEWIAAREADEERRRQWRAAHPFKAAAVVAQEAE